MPIFSPLCDIIMQSASSNYTAKRNNTIKKQTPHHTAGVLSARQIGAIFQNPNRKASANYGIGNDGLIVGMVGEESRAWTSSSPSNDHQAITYEVSNDQVGGEWHVSDRAINRLIDLMVDVQKRNPNTTHYIYDGSPNGTITRHDMFANTTCPGPYLASKLPWITEEVNRRISEGVEPSPIPEPSPVGGRNVGDVVTITGIFVSSTSTNRLNPSRTKGTITKIILGAKNPYLLDNGNLGWTNDGCIVDSSQPAPNPQPQPTGSTYTVKAGDFLSKIGAEVGVNWKDIASLNNIHSPYTIYAGQVLQLPGKYTPTLKSDEEICAEVWAGKWGTGADRVYRLSQAGYDPNRIQSLVNKGVGKGGSTGGSTPTPSKSALDVAREIWYKGNWGTGDERRNRLKAAGYNPDEVQRYINQLASGKIK